MSINEIVERVANDMIELEKENKELRNQIKKLENKYVWGLQPIDYAFVKYGGSPLLNDLEKDNYYSSEELTNEELHNKAIELMDSDKHQIFGWHEVIEHMEFDSELEKVLITLVKRHGG